MKCKISCSYGDLIDKITILKIKSSKIVDKDALKNVKHELKILESENSLTNKSDELFDELHNVNKRLWILEDLIREKSKKKQFDSSYINIAESIHKTNDKRCELKKSINIKYNSDIIEEKSYNKKNNTMVNYDSNDVVQLEKGKRFYTIGLYNESYSILSSLMDKVIGSTVYDNFYVDLHFAYNNVLRIFNIKDKINDDKLKYIIDNINDLFISLELKEYCKSQYSTECLHNKCYNNNNYINYINYIVGPNINFDNMSFFQKDDIGKTLLTYDGGGIGDKFMFARFLPLLCEKYSNNNIIFFVNDYVTWFFNDCFRNIKNIKIIGYSQSYLIGNYDHHCSLMSLMNYLNISYSDIQFTPMFKNINYKCEEKHLQIINKIKKSKNKTFVFNWKGNPKNTHEQNNRKMELSQAEPLFKIHNINWIVITKDISSEERKILNQHNVDYYGDILDNGNNSFEDSISILKNVDGVFSTDTSLVHLSANLDIQTYVLLTLGCEWRWTKNDKFTRWYPKSVLLRQSKFNDWTSVIDQILHLGCWTSSLTIKNNECYEKM
jgi:hypothetical protein